MSKFPAAANDPESVAWRTRRNADGFQKGAAEPSSTPKPASAAPAFDADMLDFVNKFEQAYADVAPVDDLQREPAEDDLFPEFPDPFDTQPARGRVAGGPRTLELARREPTIAREWTPPVRLSVEPPLEAATQVDIDEAFSILRAAEAKGAASAQRAADDAQAMAEERAARASSAPQARAKPQEKLQHAPVPLAPATANWTTKVHRPHTIAVAAGVVALIVGITAGYVAGRTPDSRPQAKIATSQQGGTQLRFDYDLRKR
jgi:hypothetical protein